MLLIISSGLSDALNDVHLRLLGLALFKRRHTLERVFDAERLVLRDTECVVREHVESLDVTEAADESAECPEILGVVGVAVDDDVTYPGGDALVCKVTRKRKHTRVAVRGESLMLFAVDMLYIEHNEVNVAHQLVELLAVLGRVRAEGNTRGIKAGVYPLRLSE